MDLIPTNTVAITEAHYPCGWYVAKYDGEGLTTSPRWFETRNKAENYAEELKR